MLLYEQTTNSSHTPAIFTPSLLWLSNSCRRVDHIIRTCHAAEALLAACAFHSRFAAISSCYAADTRHDREDGGAAPRQARPLHSPVLDPPLPHLPNRPASTI